MPLVSFQDLMRAAEKGSYAVGYFESWNLESLLAVADAAEAMRSPVILGFSGIYLPHPQRIVHDALGTYAPMAMDVCKRLTVPACLLFNESANLKWVYEAIDLGFNMVMYTDEALDLREQTARVRSVVERARARGAAVEGELTALPGVGGGGHESEDLRLTDPTDARRFIEATGVQSLAVNIGQVHLHGRRSVPLDLTRLSAIREVASVPLALHGASSINAQDLRTAIQLGVRKINVGSVLKQAYLRALRRACEELPAAHNPYEVIGSGLSNDVLSAGRIAMKKVVQDLMGLFGSVERA